MFGVNAIFICNFARTFGISCDMVKDKIKTQISTWKTADNCPNGAGEKCLYTVRIVRS